MGNRLSKIVTKTGDNGTTGLATGDRASKCSKRIEAIGSVDELNANVGWVVSMLTPNDVIWNILRNIQHRLFDLGGQLSLVSQEIIDESDVAYLERHIVEINEAQPPLKNFILPGGSELSSRLFVVTTVCRRAERALVALNEQATLENTHGVKFLNRLSDLLFVMARYYSPSDILWQPKEKADV